MVKDYWPGDPPTPPTTGSGVKPPPPPIDYGTYAHCDGTFRHYPPEPKEHLEIFNHDGEKIFESFWLPTGTFRLRVGWFGRVTIEMQEVISPGIIKAVYRWRRAPRGTLVMLHNLPQPRN